MSDFLKMDIFFVVATIALVLVAAMMCVLLWYGIRILRIIERIGVSIEEETVALKADLDDARVAAKTEGKKFLGLIRAFHRSIKRLLSSKTS